MTTMHHFGFIGFGLIGGSVAHALREQYPDSELMAYNYNIINSLTHFSGSFIGKGNGKDVPRVDAIFLDQIGDTVCQYTGFAGPCTC